MCGQIGRLKAFARVFHKQEDNLANQNKIQSREYTTTPCRRHIECELWMTVTAAEGNIVVWSGQCPFTAVVWDWLSAAASICPSIVLS